MSLHSRATADDTGHKKNRSSSNCGCQGSPGSRAQAIIKPSYCQALALSKARHRIAPLGGLCFIPQSLENKKNQGWIAFCSWVWENLNTKNLTLFDTLTGYWTRPPSTFLLCLPNTYQLWSFPWASKVQIWDDLRAKGTALEGLLLESIGIIHPREETCHQVPGANANSSELRANWSSVPAVTTGSSRQRTCVLILFLLGEEGHSVEKMKKAQLLGYKETRKRINKWDGELFKEAGANICIREGRVRRQEWTSASVRGGAGKGRSIRTGHWACDVVAIYRDLIWLGIGPKSERKGRMKWERIAQLFQALL